MPTSDPATLVWNQSSSAGTERVVLLALAKFADDDGYCWPGLDRLVPMANVSERAVQAAIAKLILSGELATLRGRGRGHHTLYRILLGQPEGAGDPAVMLAWLRGKTSPHLAAMYGDLAGDPPGRVQPASPFATVRKVPPASPIRPERVKRSVPKKVKQSVETPRAYRNELPDSEQKDLPPSAGAPAPSANAGTLIAEYVEACVHRPPGRFLGQLAREAKLLLDEGISAEHVRGGLAIVRERGLHPSALASATNEAMNPPRPRQQARRVAANGQAGANPTDLRAAADAIRAGHQRAARLRGLPSPPAPEVPG